MKASLISVNGWWHLRVRGQGRNLTRSLHTKNEDTAQNSLNTVNAQLERRGNLSLLKLSDLTLGTFSVSLKNGIIQLKPDTLERYQTSLRLFCAWCALQNISLALDVNENLVRRYAEHLSKTLSGGTIRSHLMALAKIWTDNHLDNSIFHAKTVRPKVIEGTRSDIPVSELQSILAVNEGNSELYGILLIGIYCGLRLGDIVSLRYESVRHAELNIRTRKTGFLLNFKLPAAVELWLSKRKRGALLHAEGYIFPEFQKLYLKNRSLVSARSNRAIAKVIPKRTEQAPNRSRAVSRYSFHSFRHSFCMRLVESGESFTQIRKLTGTSVRLLSTRYGDHIKKRDCDRAVREASERLDHGLWRGK